MLFWDPESVGKEGCGTWGGPGSTEGPRLSCWQQRNLLATAASGLALSPHKSTKARPLAEVIQLPSLEAGFWGGALMRPAEEGVASVYTFGISPARLAKFQSSELALRVLLTK